MNKGLKIRVQTLLFTLRGGKSDGAQNQTPNRMAWSTIRPNAGVVDGQEKSNRVLNSRTSFYEFAKKYFNTRLVTSWWNSISLLMNEDL